MWRGSPSVLIKYTLCLIDAKAGIIIRISGNSVNNIDLKEFVLYIHYSESDLLFDFESK